MPKINCERDKYVWIYSESGSRSYGKRNHGHFACEIIKDLDPKTLLDIGCGKGQFVEWINRHGIMAIGMDFASGYGLMADLLDIPFPNNSFDMITAFDVLEHLLPETLEQGLNEMFRVAKKWWVLSIGYGPSRIKTPDGGMALHPIATRDKSWWTPILSKFAELKNVGCTRSGNPYILCSLKKHCEV